MQLAPRPSLTERKTPEKTMARIDFALMAFFGVLESGWLHALFHSHPLSLTHVEFAYPPFTSPIIPVRNLLYDGAFP
jgi:hypothetical protein